MKTKLFFLLTFLTANKQRLNGKNNLNNGSKLFEKSGNNNFLVAFLSTLMYAIFGFIQKNIVAAFEQMKLSQSQRKVNALGVLTLALLFGANEMKGQYSITATGSGNTYTQNFNNFAGTAATLPTNWAVATASYNATYPVLTSGAAPPTVANASGNNCYAGRSGSVSSDYCILQKQVTSGSTTFTFSVTNGTGSTINGFTITWKAKQYSAAGRASTVDFKYRTNGGSYVSTGITGTTLYTSSTGSSTTFSESSTAYSITITGLTLTNTQTVDFQFSVANGTGSGSNAHVGIDDFTMYATAAAAAPSLAINGTLAHGSVCPTIVASPQTYTITNTGSVAATGVTLVSSDSQFVVSALSSTTIAASGGTATYNVTFTPTSAGAKTATITVASTTSGSNSPTSALTGTGTTAVTQTVTASAATGLTATTATLNGNVTALGVCPSTTVKGFVYSKTSLNSNPLVGDANVTNTTVAGLTTGPYTSSIAISSGTNYSYKAYVYDGTTYVYSSLQTFIFNVLTPQTITFNTLSAVTYGDTALTLSATASSGLAVSYSSSNTAVASISGSTVTFLSNGTVNITASQAGDGTYNAAPDVVQSLTINQKALTVSPVAANNKTYSGTNAATITGTLVGIVGADVVTFNGTGTFVSANVGTAISVSSTSTLGGANSSKYTLTQPTGLTASITQAPQTISFAALANKTVGDSTFSAGATSATSGVNALIYSSSNPAVATINVSGLITLVSAGSTIITVSQAGDSNYTAAADVSNTLLVNAAPIAAWQLNGKLGNETSVSAGTLDTNLNTSTLIRGSALNASALGNAFSSTNYTVSGTKAGEIAANKFISFTLNAKTGYKVSLSTLDVRLRRPNTGPNSFRWQYSTDGSTFTDIGTADINFTSIITGGVAQTPLNLSVIPDLQNVPYTSTITLRLVAWGATDTAGTFAIGRSLTSTSTDYSLQIGGTVTVKEAVWETGAWSNTAGPNANLDAVIKDVYTVPTNGTFIAKKLTVDGAGSFTANAGSTVTLTDNLVNSLTADKVVFNSSASLMQNSTLANPNAITYKRATASLAHDFDVVYLGSPLENPTLGSVWMTTANDTFYSFNTALAGGQNWETAAPTATMDPAKGFIARAVLGSPNWTTLGTSYTMNFVGKPNNGNYNYTIVKEGADNVHNLIANPYPSALDLIAFSTDTDNSSQLTGNYYFWINNAGIGGNNNYSDTDYATYNVNINAGTGVGNPATVGGTTPTRYVAAGQAFFTEAAAAGTVIFKNTHRVADNNSTFYRTSAQQASVYSDKVWLNLSNNQGLFKQQIVAYTQQATSGFDTNFDAKTFDGNPAVDFYSIIPSAKLTIQSRPAFNANDVVALGFRTTTAGTFQININQTDGVFATGQRVYLQDNLLGLDFDITTAAYSFTTQVGTFDNRFVLKYTSALSTNATVYDNSILVTTNKNVVKIFSSMEDMATVSIFDLLGREVYKKAINAKEFTATNVATNQQVLVVKITLTNGAVVTKKIMF